jgi:hypothetical protein
MAIDLSALLGGGASTATMSPLAMYKRLQKTAADNEAAREADSDLEKAKAVTREFNNAAIRLRNTQYKQQNAAVANDVTYFKNRAATATTVAELINDDRFLKVLAYSNGFKDLYLNDRQRLRDLLTSDLNDSNSVARTGTLQELEFAKKYNFGAAGTLLDTNGNTVGIDADGELVNDGSQVTDLPAGLAKLRGLAVDLNGAATLDADGALADGPNLVNTDGVAYSRAESKQLLDEEKAPAKPSVSATYEFESAEYQQFLQRSDLQRDIEYYRTNIKDIKSLDDLFEDYRLLKFLLSSYDLESEVQFPGKVRKIIESDLTDVDSLANRFQDPRFKQLAQDLNVNILGVTKLKFDTTTSDVVTRYQRLAYERSLDEQAPGVRAAIEFGRRIKDVSQTVQLLGDSVLREVITVANNIPKELAFQEVGSQVTALERKVDVNSLKSDQNEIEKVVLRYLTFKDAGGTGGGQSYLLNLFG